MFSGGRIFLYLERTRILMELVAHKTFSVVMTLHVPFVSHRLIFAILIHLKEAHVLLEVPLISVTAQRVQFKHDQSVYVPRIWPHDQRFILGPQLLTLDMGTLYNRPQNIHENNLLETVIHSHCNEER